MKNLIILTAILTSPAALAGELVEKVGIGAAGGGVIGLSGKLYQSGETDVWNAGQAFDDLRRDKMVEGGFDLEKSQPFTAEKKAELKKFLLKQEGELTVEFKGEGARAIRLQALDADIYDTYPRHIGQTEESVKAMIREQLKTSDAVEPVRLRINMKLNPNEISKYDINFDRLFSTKKSMMYMAGANEPYAIGPHYGKLEHTQHSLTESKYVRPSKRTIEVYAGHVDNFEDFMKRIEAKGGEFAGARRTVDRFTPAQAKAKFQAAHKQRSAGIAKSKLGRVGIGAGVLIVGGAIITAVDAAEAPKAQLEETANFEDSAAEAQSEAAATLTD